MTRLTPSGEWTLRFDHPDLSWEAAFPNGVTYQGANYLQDAGFRGGTQFTAWYVGLISNAGFSAVSDGDTDALHPGWSEFTGLFGSLRPAWTPAAANGGLMSAGNSVFQVTSNGTVRGAFLCSQQAVGAGTSQVLYAHGAADAGLAVLAGGTLTLSYKARLNPR